MLKISLIIIAVYAMACSLLYFKQRDLLFFPVPENTRADADALWLETGQARLKIWQVNEGKQAIIYFGGNAETVELNIPDFKPLLKDFAIYLVNYRGYGGSSGTPSEQALFHDALAIYDALIKHHDSIHVIGRSLGSGVASYLAQQREIEKLVLITPFDSVRNVAQRHYPLFPVKWLIKDPFDSLRLAESIDNPTLILIAEKDEVVPLAHSQNLIEALSLAKVEAHVIRGSHHNNITDSPATMKYLQQFLLKPHAPS